MADIEGEKNRKPGWLRRLLSPRGRADRHEQPTSEEADAAEREEKEEDEENPDLDFQPGGWVGATEPRRRE